MPIVQGITTGGVAVPVLVDDTGKVIMSVGTHTLLDGDLHSDTVVDTPSKGSIIVGVDQGGGSIKWDELTVGADGDVLTAQADGTVAYETPAAGGGGAWTLIQEQLLSGSAASVTFSSIPGTYKNLMLEFNARVDGAGGSDNIYLRCNSDSGSNYDYARLYARASGTVGADGAVSGTSAQIAVVPGGGAPTGAAVNGRLYILNYARTTFHKMMQSRTVGKFGTTTTDIVIYDYLVHWRSTSAITTLYLYNLAGNNFIAGCDFQLYGVQ